MKLFDKVLVPAELESFHAVRLQPMLLPDAMNRRLTQTLSFRHRSCTPMRRRRWRGVQGGFHNSSNFTGGNAWNAPRPRSVFFQSGQAQPQKPLTPQMHGRTRNADLFSHLLVSLPLGGQSDDPGSLNHAQWQTPSSLPAFQHRLFFRRQHNSLSNPHGDHHTNPTPIHKETYESPH